MPAVGRLGMAHRMLGLVGTGALMATALVPGNMAAQGPSDAALDTALSARQSVGLKSNREHVRNLLKSAQHVDAEKWGFPLTNSDAAELRARSTSTHRLDKQVMPYLRSLPEYGGAWIDQKDGGRLVVNLTEDRQSLKDETRSRMPAQTRGVRFETVNDSASELHRALRTADVEWAELGTGFRPQAFAISHRNNRVVIKVLPGQIEKARAHKDAIKARLGVDVAFEETTRIVDSGCPSRHKCFGPLQLGARINEPNVYNSSNHFGQWNCAIGFMLADKKILTAGHCTYGDRAGPWKGHSQYQSNYGKIGDRTSQRYTSENRDLALIKLEDWNANKSTQVYGSGPYHVLLDEAGVVDNMTICVSLNRQDKYWCGTVKHPSAKWISTTANPDIWVWGAGMKFFTSGRTSLKGDSGGPIVQPVCAPGAPGCVDALVPIGIVNSGNEVDGSSQNTNNGNNINDDLYFAKVQWALNNQDGWPSKTIYKGPEGTG